MNPSRATSCLPIILIVALVGCRHDETTGASSYRENQPREYTLEGSVPVKESETQQIADPSEYARRDSDYTNKWAIVIGIDNYPDWPHLQNAVNDADSVGSTMRDEFGFNKIEFIKDEGATGLRIRKAFAEFPPRDELTEKDAVFLFFSGHGATGYIAPFDSDPNNLEATGIPFSWLLEKIGSLKCRHKAIILDSCSSGSLFSNIDVLTNDSGVTHQPAVPLAGTRGVSQDLVAEHQDNLSEFEAHGISYFLRRPAFQGLSASRLQTAADQLGEDGHSIFTSQLLAVLRERANSIRKDHAFTFREMAVQVATRVENAPASYQIPDFRHLQPGDGEFIFRPTLRRLTPREQQLQNLNAAKARADSEEKRAAVSNYATKLNRAVNETLTGKNLTGASNVLEQSQTGLRHWEYQYVQKCIEANAKMVYDPVHQVRSLRLSPDGKLVATGGTKGAIVLWDTESGQRVSRISGHSDQVVAVEFSHDGRYLASGGWDGAMKLWNVNDGDLLREFGTNNGLIESIVFNEDDSQIASASRSQGVRIWNTMNGEQVTQFSEEDRRHSARVEFMSDNRQIALLSGNRLGSEAEFKNGRITIREISTGTELAVISADELGLRGLCLSPDGKWIASCTTSTSHPEILVWDVATGKVRNRFSGHSLSVADVVFAADGEHLLAVDFVGNIKIWSMVSGTEVRTIMTPRTDDQLLIPFSLSASASGNWVAMGGAVLDSRDKPAGGMFSLFKVRPTLEVRDLHAMRHHELFGDFAFEGRFEGLAISPDSQQVAVAAGTDVVVLNMLDGRWLFDTEAPSNIEGVAFSHDGTHVVAGGYGGLKVWNLRRDSELSILDDGRYVGAFAVSPDSTLIATAGGKDPIRVWELESSKLLCTLADSNVFDMTFSPAGNILASVGDHETIKLWDIDTGMKMKEFIGHDGATRRVAFSPDGLLLASCSNDKSIRLWRVKDQQELYHMTGHNGWVFDIDFSPDGKRLVSCSFPDSSDDVGEIRIWDVETGQHLLAIRESAPLMEVCFSPDGKTIATAGMKGMLRLRTVDTGHGPQ